MIFKDEATWKKARGNNSDGYGKAGLDFAEAWANLMEERMKDGTSLADIAKQASKDVKEIKGLSGFQYGMAVEALAAVWVHGEDLRRWHNLDTQIKDEGEKANESGSTLNPALMTVEGHDKKK